MLDTITISTRNFNPSFLLSLFINFILFLNSNIELVARFISVDKSCQHVDKIKK